MENTNGFWKNSRILFKSALICALILLLLIPTAFIQSLVSERQQRQQDAIKEISARWAGSQTVTGPVIGIPYLDATSTPAQKVKRWAYFLPDKLNMNTHLLPEKRYRGIFQVIVYTAEIDIRGSFDSLHLEELGLSSSDMLWKEAALFFDVTDVQGLNEDIVMHLQTSDHVTQSADLTLRSKLTTSQFKAPLSASLPDWITPGSQSLYFSSAIRLKGSGNLLFVPSGRETKISASSAWSTPSFTGSILPDLRTVKDTGFIADWKVLALNRKFPQQWKQDYYDLGGSAFGVNLLVPVDTYQQTTRCVKYSILIIVLTFAAFLLIEWIYSLVIHAFQYVLVGFALCIFYTLLLSLSEYFGFGPAYVTAAAATIGLIVWYVNSLLHSSKISLFVTFLLALQYGFVYFLTQLEDYALLMGSIGLFIILALVMYFSRKIKWEQGNL